MTLFWILAALMVLGGLLAMTPALLRRTSNTLETNKDQNVAIARERLRELEAQLADKTIDQRTYEQEKDELEKGLLQDVGSDEQFVASSGNGHGRIALAMAGVLVPALAVGLYFYLGSPQHIDVSGPGGGAASPHAGVGQKEAPTAEELITLLEERSRANPEDPDAWFMLGRMYATSGRFDDAVKAYEKLVSITNNHPTALVVLADALAMVQDGKIAGRPQQLVEQALDIEPDNTTALWLAGRGSAEVQEYAAAMSYFERAAVLLSDKPELLGQLNEQIQEVRTAALSAGVDLPAVQLPDAAPGVTIQITVSLDPALQAELAETDTLFIFARAVDGPPMPIAAIKRQAGELPLRVMLDDNAMLKPGNKLSQHAELKLAARISKSGQPVASAGDLQSESALIRPGYDSDVNLVINQQVP